MAPLAWPAFLIRSIDPDVRTKITDYARDSMCSVQDVIRWALCERYELDCTPVSSAYPDRDQGAATVVVRLPPEVFDALKEESKTGVSMQDIVHHALFHYVESLPSVR